MTTDPVQHLPPSQSYSSPPVTIVLTVILLVFLFVGFFSIYFCRCVMQNVIYNWHLRHSPSGTPVGPLGSVGAPGLDPSIIQSFPTFTYSSVKGLRKEKYGLECAICLCEFEDIDMLRLMTSCCHVFHQECVDLWLESHKTCPVCRRSLDSPTKSQEKSSYCFNNGMNDIIENESLEDAISINIKVDNEDEREGRRSGDGTTEQSVGHDKADKFPRSHSTGHSIIVRANGDEDRFTLRLPEHVKAKLISPGHNWTRSCTAFGEYKSKTSNGNGGFGEASGLSGGNVTKV